MTVFREGLKGQMSPGKKAICDGGYATSAPDEVSMMAFPNSLDHPDLKKFKSRARCRHETVNGWIKNFQSMSETFCHGMIKHKMAFEAICVIVQYQMDNGAYIFDV